MIGPRDRCSDLYKQMKPGCGFHLLLLEIATFDVLLFNFCGSLTFFFAQKKNETKGETLIIK